MRKPQPKEFFFKKERNNHLQLKMGNIEKKERMIFEETGKLYLHAPTISNDCFIKILVHLIIFHPLKASLR